MKYDWFLLKNRTETRCDRGFVVNSKFLDIPGIVNFSESENKNSEFSRLSSRDNYISTRRYRPNF